jgi:hypothetical protein
VGRLRVLAVAFVAASAFAASGLAGSSAVFLHLIPSTVHRGHVVTIRGNAGTCAVGNTVYVISRAFVHTHQFAGVSAVLAKVRAGGAFGARTRIPARRHVGRYSVTARCGGGNLGIVAHLKVVA